MAIVTPENQKRNSQIMDLYFQGLSFRKIAWMLDLNVGVISGVVHRSGKANRGGFKANLDVLCGQRFGRLLVLHLDRYNDDGNPYWMCQCSCGRKHSVLSRNLKQGRTRSCGCLARETSSQRMRTAHAKH